MTEIFQKILKKNNGKLDVNRNKILHITYNPYTN